MIHEILPDGNDDPPAYPIAYIVEALESLALDMAWEKRNLQLQEPDSSED